MALEIEAFQSLIPSRFLSFAFPNPTDPTRLLRVAVLDSPIPHSPPLVAALIVPPNRESDWVFSTESGHFQLLLSSSPQLSRLLLIGDNPQDSPPTSYFSKPVNTQYVESLLNALEPLFMGLFPWNFDKGGSFLGVPVLDYESNVVSSLVLVRRVGDFAGEMLVEDVELESCSLDERSFGRRLRFKRMPNLVQTEIRIIPDEGFGLDGVDFFEGVKFVIDLRTLVHSYLIPMVAGVSLIAGRIEDRIREGFRPKALCLGVGGGALLSFLRTQLEFDVVGVEIDEEVLRVAREFFGLEDCGVRVCVGNAMEFVKRLARQRGVKNRMSREVEEDCCFKDGNDCGADFDVVMVDLDCSDARSGVSAPPLEFVKRDVLLAARDVLSDNGILVVNVIPLSRSFFDSLINVFREVFYELHEIDVGNEENFVLIATTSPVKSSPNDCRSSFLNKLRESISGKHLDSIRKI